MNRVEQAESDGVQFYGLGFVAAAADGLTALQEYLDKPAGVPYVILRLAILEETRTNLAVGAELSQTEAFIHRGWSVLRTLSQCDWGIQVLLRCGIASMMAQLRFVPNSNITQPLLTNNM